LNGLLKSTMIPCYLTDQTQYEYVRTLIISGRARAMSVNLLVKGALLGISDVARRLGVPIRLLYLSNAEEYWKYGDIYRENIRSLFCDSASRVVRTESIQWITKDYLYNVQPLEDYQRYLQFPWIRRVYQIVPRKYDAKTKLELLPVEHTAEQAEAIHREQLQRPEKKK